MKKCTKCKIEKTEEEFGKNNRALDKLSSWCKKCNKEYMQQYQKDNKAQITITKKKYNKTHRQEKNKSNKIWRENNSEKDKEFSKNWKSKNKEKINFDSKNRRQNDPVFKLKMNLRCRLKKAIKSQSGAQAYRTLELLGCTGQEAHKYLESLFTEGMSWENYGFGNDKWHIDHILPCDSFDLTNPEEQKKCFHYTNLQPLWQQDNLKKGNKIL